MKELVKTLKNIAIVVAATLVLTLAVLVMVDIDNAELIVGGMSVIALIISTILELTYFKLEKVEEIEEL